MRNTLQYRLICHVFVTLLLVRFRRCSSLIGQLIPPIFWLDEYLCMIDGTNYSVQIRPSDALGKFGCAESIFANTPTRAPCILVPWYRPISQWSARQLAQTCSKLTQEEKVGACFSVIVPHFTSRAAGEIVWKLFTTKLLGFRSLLTQIVIAWLFLRSWRLGQLVHKNIPRIEWRF